MPLGDAETEPTCVRTCAHIACSLTSMMLLYGSRIPFLGSKEKPKMASIIRGKVAGGEQTQQSNARHDATTG